MPYLMWAASKGDLPAILKLESQGVELSSADYDGRPLFISLHQKDTFK